MLGFPLIDRAIDRAIDRVGGVSVALRRAWFGVGPLATARAMVRHFKRSDPEVHRPRTAPSGPHPFDVANGVDTGGFVSWRDLQTGGSNDPYISGYIGVTPSVGRRMIALVERPEEYVFIDIGCGKGRAAVLASERGFRRIIGVEIAAALAAAARQNAAALRARFPERPAIEIVHGDATQYELPPEKLVLFLYQPFEKPVMRVLLRRLAESLAAAPRPMVLIYLYPALAGMIDRSPLWERAAEGAFEPEADEVPFSYGGRGGSERFMIWVTRQGRPEIATIES